MSSTDTNTGATKPARKRKADPALTVDGATKSRRAAAKTASGSATATPVPDMDVQRADVMAESSTPRYTEAQWRAMVAEAAYLKAEQRGFINGSAEQDWLEAEEELRRSIGDVYER